MLEHIGGHTLRTILLLTTSLCCYALGATYHAESTRVTASINGIKANILLTGSHPGAVIASPSAYDPDYYYHWVRDSALVMKTVLDWSKPPSKGTGTRTLFDIFIQYSRYIQERSRGKLGEPKYYVDGEPYLGPWGRPQNDGPALRAITFIQYAEGLLAQGETVSQDLYHKDIKARSLIKTDLEYVAHHWNEPSYDLWEEVKGDHFYTLMTQRKALLDGARLAARLHDKGASDYYWDQAKQIEQKLEHFWSPEKQILRVTLNRVEGIPYKESELDVAIILASLHASEEGGVFSPTDKRILSTALALKNAFQQLYRINQNTALGVAIGRYPEDRYNGHGSSVENPGNPWFLTTHAFAELYYAVANAIDRKVVQADVLNHPLFREMNSVQKLRNEGDRLMARTNLHTDADCRMSEQFARENGFMTGARDLTWSYASLLTAIKTNKEKRPFPSLERGFRWNPIETLLAPLQWD